MLGCTCPLGSLHLYLWSKYLVVQMLGHRIALFVCLFVLNFLKTLHTIFQSGCTSLSSYQQCRRVLLSLERCDFDYSLLLEDSCDAYQMDCSSADCLNGPVHLLPSSLSPVTSTHVGALLTWRPFLVRCSPGLQADWTAAKCFRKHPHTLPRESDNSTLAVAE